MPQVDPRIDLGTWTLDPGIQGPRVPGTDPGTGPGTPPREGSWDRLLMYVCVARMSKFRAKCDQPFSHRTRSFRGRNRPSGRSKPGFFRGGLGLEPWFQDLARIDPWNHLPGRWFQGQDRGRGGPGRARDPLGGVGHPGP